MNKSEDIKDLAVALSGFNSEISQISKDAKNPQFRSEYVTLDRLIEITRPILQKNGLSIMQTPLAKESGEIGVQTLIIHETGQFIESEALYMTPVKMVKGGAYELAKDPQAAGSTISYLRRYSYQAILNLNTGEDDDGNNGSGSKSYNKPQDNQNTPPASQVKPQDTNTPPTTGTLTEPQIKRLYAIGNSAGVDAKGIDVIVKNKYKIETKNISKVHYDELITNIQDNAEQLKAWLAKTK